MPLVAVVARQVDLQAVAAMGQVAAGSRAIAAAPIPSVAVAVPRGWAAGGVGSPLLAAACPTDLAAVEQQDLLPRGTV